MKTKTRHGVNPVRFSSRAVDREVKTEVLQRKMVSPLDITEFSVAVQAGPMVQLKMDRDPKISVVLYR